MQAFTAAQDARYAMFMKTFKPVTDNIDAIYKQLTVSSTHPLGGTAYLSTENADEPYINPTKCAVPLPIP